MKDHRISKFVNDLFYDVAESQEAYDQKEELFTHLSERVNDYMTAGLSFDEAFEAARDGLGDPEELIGGFERKRAIVVDEVEGDRGVRVDLRLNLRFKGLMTRLVPLSPFIYVILGITQNSWMPWLPGSVTLNFWIWGWVIIPITAILTSGMGVHLITATSPFIYVLLGVFFGWWAWGWLIIPISGILFSSGSTKKKKKKKKKHVGDIIEIDKGDKKIIVNRATGNVEIERYN